MGASGQIWHTMIHKSYMLEPKNPGFERVNNTFLFKLFFLGGALVTVINIDIIFIDSCIYIQIKC